jgi:hypothetical protein
MVGTVAGFGFSTATIAGIEKLGHLALGSPGDPAQASTAMQLVVLAGWVLGAAIGGFIGSGIARWAGAAWIVGGLVAVGVLLNQISVPTPLWLSTAGICLALLTAKLIAQQKSWKAVLEPGPGQQQN